MLTLLAALIYKEQQRANEESSGMDIGSSTTLFSWAFMLWFLWPMIIFMMFNNYAQRPGVGFLIGSGATAATLIIGSWPLYLVVGFFFMIIAAFVVVSVVLNAGESEE